MSNELQKSDRGAVDVIRPQMDIEGLFRQAIEKGPDGVAVLERLMVIRAALREIERQFAAAADISR